MNLFKKHINTIVIEDNLYLNPSSQLRDLPKCNHIILSAKFNGNIGSALCALELLGLQKPAITRSKTNSLSLGLKKGEVVGCKVVLRKNAIYTFLERFIIEILPSVKKLSSLRINKDSLHWHFSDIFVLDDISNHYLYLQGLDALDIVVKTKNAKPSYYQGLRLPLKKDL